MSITPPFPEIGDLAVVTDEDVVDRVHSVLERALRRKFWLMFLDDEHRQLPVLLPRDLPRSPRPIDVKELAVFFRGVAENITASTMIVTFERPGLKYLTDSDVRWLVTLHEAAVLSTISFRGPLLCHSGGVRDIDPREYLAA